LAIGRFDKSKLPPGPWHSEPDQVAWICERLPCLILRMDSGSLNGYVAVPLEWHPFAREHTDDFDVHGGVTYPLQMDTYRTEVWRDRFLRAHPDNTVGALAARVHVGISGLAYWWIGFDASHAGDLIPDSRYPQHGDPYRDIDYVKANTERLARQIARVELIDGTEAL
jgi:hypothetical protein